MNDRVKQFRVGVVVLATRIIGAILVTLNGPTSTEWIPGLDKHYQVTIELREAPGIGPNTPIRKNGLLIGRVAEVEDLQDHVAVKANIDAGRLLYRTLPRPGPHDTPGRRDDRVHHDAASPPGRRPCRTASCLPAPSRPVRWTRSSTCRTICRK